MTSKPDSPWAVIKSVNLSPEPVKAEKRIEVVAGRITDYEIIYGQAIEIAELRRRVGEIDEAAPA